MKTLRARRLSALGVPAALVLGDAALQSVVDKSWSRRDRWREFHTIAGLGDAHSPTQGRRPALLGARPSSCSLAVRLPLRHVLEKETSPILLRDPSCLCLFVVPARFLVGVTLTSAGLYGDHEIAVRIEIAVVDLGLVGPLGERLGTA